MLKNCCEDKNVELLVIGERAKKGICSYQRFQLIHVICNYTLHRGTKNVYGFCLQAFRKADAIKFHIKDCLKIDGNKGLIFLQIEYG